MSLKAGLCIPTFNAGSEWQQCLDALLLQDIALDTLLVIDSSSQDRTVKLAKDAGLVVCQIDQADFDHGATRQIAVDKMADVDVVIFLTQDAILASPDSIRKLIAAFDDPSVGAAYGRQLPRKAASYIEAHSRIFNYSEVSRLKSIENIDELGIKAAFISNSFAAYRVSLLDKISGFPNNVIFGEDMYVATKFIKAGYKVAYAADACVYHSHSYTLWQEMRRYFDMGVFHSREPWIRQELGCAEGEGLKFVVSEIKYLSRHAFWLVPESLFRTILRFIGFRMGLLEQKLPMKLKKILVMNKSYFK